MKHFKKVIKRNLHGKEKTLFELIHDSKLIEKQITFNLGY